MCRLAAVGRAAQRQLLVAQGEFIGGARLHQRQRLEGFYRGARKNRRRHIAGGKDFLSGSVDDGDRAAMAAFNEAAADDFDDDRIDHGDARSFAPGQRPGAARRYCGGCATSPPSTWAACQPQCGSSRKARASATMSAEPSATMLSACLGLAIKPTTRVGRLASRRICRASGTL